MEVSCPAGGPACVVSVADDGSVRYESTGGVPSVMSTEMGLVAVPANHGLVAMDRFTVAPGASEERGNVEVSCPAGGPACVVSVADDGSVRYESTGGVPSVMSTEMGLVAVPANHGLVAMDRFTVAPGASEERGNVEVSCPAGGPACVVSVADDGSVRYESTGGVPWMSAEMGRLRRRRTRALSDGPVHGGAGASVVRGNVECSCPAGGPACVVSVADDGSVRYESTGGMPSVMLLVLTSEKIENILNTRAANSGLVISATPERTSDIYCAIDCELPGAIISLVDPPRYDFSNFRFTENRRGVSVAKTPLIEELIVIQGPLTETIRTTYRALGGWMDHSFFYLQMTTMTGVETGIHFDYTITSGGRIANSNPAIPMTGAATWSGIMLGVVNARGNSFVNGVSVNGDATITADLDVFGLPTVDVMFENITDESSAYFEIEDMVWRDLGLVDGTFASSIQDLEKVQNPGIVGRFYGPNHEEVGGVFRRDANVGPIGNQSVGAIVGAFGAKRTN